jgi:hypothetical protein
VTESLKEIFGMETQLTRDGKNPEVCTQPNIAEFVIVHSSTNKYSY